MMDLRETGPDRTFRDGLAEGRIRLQRCDACGRHVFYPRTFCPHCHSDALSWTDASGDGTVYTTTVVRRRTERGGDYNVCMVELAEGVRMMSRVDGIAPAGRCHRYGGKGVRKRDRRDAGGPVPREGGLNDGA